MKKGVMLLKKRADKAWRGIGCHEVNSCPINKAYRIDATDTWDDLTKRAKEILSKDGWSPRSYDSFILWYDDDTDMAEKELLKALRP